MKKMEKKWPFVFNGIVIFCLILLILGMRWQAKKEESEVLNVTESSVIYVECLEKERP